MDDLLKRNIDEVSLDVMCSEQWLCEGCEIHDKIVNMGMRCDDFVESYPETTKTIVDNYFSQKR